METQEVTVIPAKKIRQSKTKDLVTSPDKPARKPRGEKSIENVSPERLIMAAVKEHASLDMLERLLNMQERIQKNKAEKAFREAMSKFQAECPVIPKRKKVFNKNSTTSVRYKYAPIDDIISIISPIVGKYDLSYTVKTRFEKQDDMPGIMAVARVFHILGHSEESTFWVPLEDTSFMTDQQRYGAARTFAARYALCDVFGIVTGDEDNDTNNAGSAEDPEAQKKNAEEEARKKEAEDEDLAKLRALPETIREGFKVLGYTAKTAIAFSKGHQWNPEKIKGHLDLLANKE